jgi:hypothetical protein
MNKRQPMKLRVLLLTAALTAAGLGARAGATDPTLGVESSKNDIAGGVIQADTRKPLDHVSVTAVSNGGAKEKKVVQTDGNGNYYFNDLKPGTYKLVFEKDGFKRVTREKVMIRQDEGFQLNVEMDEDEAFHIMPGQLFFSQYD